MALYDSSLQHRRTSCEAGLGCAVVVTVLPLAGELNRTNRYQSDHTDGNYRNELTTLLAYTLQDFIV